MKHCMHKTTAHQCQRFQWLLLPNAKEHIYQELTNTIRSQCMQPKDKAQSFCSVIVSTQPLLKRPVKHCPDKSTYICDTASRSLPILQQQPKERLNQKPAEAGCGREARLRLSEENLSRFNPSASLYAKSHLSLQHKFQREILKKNIHPENLQSSYNSNRLKHLSLSFSRLFSKYVVNLQTQEPCTSPWHLIFPDTPVLEPCPRRLQSHSVSFSISE